MLMITTESGEDSAGKEHVVSRGSLEEYFENFRALNNEFPEAWHLLAQAEDRARAEHFLRLRREAEERHARGQEPSYKPNAPWDWVFRLRAREKVYWDRNVRDPALVYLAKGGGGRPVKRPGEDPLEEAVKKKRKKETTPSTGGRGRRRRTTTVRSSTGRSERRRVAARAAILARTTRAASSRTTREPRFASSTTCRPASRCARTDEPTRARAALDSTPTRSAPSPSPRICD